MSVSSHNSIKPGCVVTGPTLGVSLEGTLAYEQSLLNLQITALGKALALCDERDRLSSQAREVRSALKALPTVIETEYCQRASRLQEAVISTGAAYKEAEARCETCQTILREAQTRIQALETGDLTAPDRIRIERSGKEAEGEHFPILQRLTSDIEACASRLDDIRENILTYDAQLAEATAELEAISQRDIPVRVQLALDKAASCAEQEYAARIKGREQNRQKLAASLKSLKGDLENTRKRIESAERSSRELEKLKSQSLFARLGSSVWWGSLSTDYAEAVREASAQKAKLDGLHSELMKELERADCELRQQSEGKQATIDQVIAEELQRQSEARQQAVQHLPNQLARLHSDLSAAQQDHAVLSRQIDAAKSASTAAGQSAALQERAKLIQEAAVETAKAKQSLVEAETGASGAKSSHEAAMAELEEMHRHRESVRHEREQQYNSQLAANQEHLERIAQDLIRLTTQHGLGVAAPFAREAFATARNSRLARVRQLCGDSRDQTADDPESRDSRSSVNRRRVSVASTPTSDGESCSVAESLSHFYVDLARNADETTTSVRHVSRLRQTLGGQFFPGWVPDYGLRDQLLRLRKRFGPEFFPDWSPDTDILFYFQELFFPDSFTGSFLFSNISLEERFPLLCVRPSVVGPRAQRSLPQGMTLAVCGHLFDNLANADNPVLVIQRIVEMSVSPPRSFEEQRSVITFALADRLYPAFQRRLNLLSTGFVTSLPPISVQTRDRLQDWLAYLNWKDRLIQAKLDGLRYAQVEVLSEGKVRFLAVAPSKDRYDQCRRLFRKDELRAFELGYSRDRWNFEYNENHRGRDIELGDFVRDEPLKSMQNVEIEGMPWNDPYAAYVYFQLNDDDQNEFDSMIQSGSEAEVVAVFRDRIHRAGFLALSVVGDVALVRRQRREIEQLQQQSGYAPFLSSYLFDIKAANTPAELVPIADDQWFRSDLNDDQKQAVRMMISAPDFAMVQGPPGTGKTTMIAEATYQLTRQGKKVLLASQASLAVNNALERLAQAPSIRAIRLSYRERPDEREHPFSQKSALGTYYAAIAQTCRQRSLDTWQQTDTLQQELTRWLTDTDLLARDISELLQSESRLEAERSRIATELGSERDALLHAEQDSARRAEAKSFLLLLDNDTEWSGVLPEDALRIFYEQTVSPLDVLPQVGIRVNLFWPDFEQGDCRQKSAFAMEILKAWRRLTVALPQLDGDLRRLEAQDGESVLSIDDSLQVANLKRQLEAVTEAMVEDASKHEEWQALQRQIRDIKRRGAGLDKSLYQQIFNGGGDPPSYLKFIDPSANRAAVVTGLRQAIDTIRSLQPTIQTGTDRVRGTLAAFLERTPTAVADAGKVRRIEGELRDVTARLSELAGQRQEKESRLQRHIAERLRLDGRSDSEASQDYRRIRELVAQRLAVLEGQMEQTRAFRNAWQPLLQSWVDDLSKRNTLRNDQQYFLPAYISACNVVGVTCTENRRTLEDVGHTRFDVVIVDEVSKATPPELVMPIMLGRTAILVGDHRQLPPLFKEHGGSWEEAIAEREENAEAAGSQELADSASELTAENFERFKKMVTASLFKEHFENAPQTLKAFLFTQYRMHPQIMRVVNQFYENRLVCGLDDPDGKRLDSDPRGHRLHRLTLNGPGGRPYLTPDQHTLWIDSTTDPRGRVHHERREGNKSKANDLEAALAAKLLCDLEIAYRAQGYGQGERNPKQVGVVTFYGRQVRSIREAVRRAQRELDLQFHAIRYDINTVDRYQGQERPIVIVSMVRNPPWKLSQRANTAQFERVNVAFSRAQELLVVLGAKEVFCNYPVNLPFLDRPGKRQVEVYRLIIDEIQRSGGFWKSEAVLGKDNFSRLTPNQQGRGASR